MKIRVITVGKIKEGYFNEAIKEYKKRLGSYANVELLEVQDEKNLNLDIKAECEKIKSTEAGRILSRISDREYVIVLDIKGETLTSEKFAKKLNDLMIRGSSDITFVIGGSIGLDDSVIKRADYKLSFSAFTFPHKLMKVILLEQIYRAFKIIKNEPYHK